MPKSERETKPRERQRGCVHRVGAIDHGLGTGDP